MNAVSLRCNVIETTSVITGMSSWREKVNDNIVEICRISRENVREVE